MVAYTIIVEPFFLYQIMQFQELEMGKLALFMEAAAAAA
jgi:hypothetical protein